MQVDDGRKVIRMYLERILEKAFPGVSAAARLQQIGLFTLIYALQGEEPVTAARVAAMTGLSDGQVLTHLRKLMALKLIKRTQIKNKQGRGRAYELTIRDTKESKRLIKAIGKATATRKRAPKSA
jgi:predicted transcriptional regulator